ncbi:MAG: hypothetical protein WA830_10205 [Candidatus Sulfotelmatobacter sp.]
MITSVSSAHANDAQEVSKPHILKVEPQIQTPKSGALSHDQVRLKSAGEVDHDAGRK